MWIFFINGQLLNVSGFFYSDFTWPLQCSKLNELDKIYHILSARQRSFQMHQLEIDEAIRRRVRVSKL